MNKGLIIIFKKEIPFDLKKFSMLKRLLFALYGVRVQSIEDFKVYDDGSRRL